MTNIVKRSPRASNISRLDLFDVFEDWFKNFGIRPFPMDMGSAPEIKIDLSENDTNYTVRAEIPGVKKDDIKVQVDGNHVSISAETKKVKEEKEGERVICRECCQGSSYRGFSLDHAIDEANTQAKYENGVLELTLPKKNGKTSKQIKIK